MHIDEVGNLVQCIIVRNDLGRSRSGKLSTSVAASSTAAVHLYSNSKYNEDNFGKLDRMSRIVLQITNDNELKQLEDKLFKKNIDYKIWVNRPERYPTCVSLRPFPKTNVQKYLENLK